MQARPNGSVAPPAAHEADRIALPLEAIDQALERAGSAIGDVRHGAGFRTDGAGMGQRRERTEALPPEDGQFHDVTGDGLDYALELDLVSQPRSGRGRWLGLNLRGWRPR